MYSYLPLLFFLSFAPSVKNSVLAPIENTLINVALRDCDQIKEALKMRYEDAQLTSSMLFNFITLTHFKNGKKFDTHKLSDAHESLLSSSDYDRSLPTLIYIHGYFGESIFFKYLIVATESMRRIKNANIFIMNAGVFFDRIYYKSSSYTRILGEKIGILLADLRSSGVTKFHLIGHSLGAHTSGFAGKKFTELTSAKLDRITGLDPAGPCFYNMPSNLRLTKTDATFVDVIHTNTDVFGIAKSLGHVDFYPNGGHIMKGCLDSNCSHGKVVVYFAESIKSNNFLAVKCTDWDTFKSGVCSANPRVIMGYGASASTPEGNYYLKTNPIYPFGRAENGIE